jgi:hypothetical protein
MMTRLDWTGLDSKFAMTFLPEPLRPCGYRSPLRGAFSTEKVQIAGEWGIRATDAGVLIGSRLEV